MTRLKAGASPLALAAALATLTISGCHPAGGGNVVTGAVANATAPEAAVPLDASGGAEPPAPAPAVADLPAAAPAPVGSAPPAQPYAAADAAQAMSAALGDAPPDYAVDAGAGQSPWVWQADDNSLRVAEPMPGGADRYYYYAPGAATPYLVRDNGYSYAFQNGVLVVIYDAGGRALPPDELRRQAEWAGRYLARARRLHDLAAGGHRQPVAESSWTARRQAMTQEHARWAAQINTDQDWRAYHDQQLRQEQAKWDLERFRRQAETARLAQQVHDKQAAAQAAGAAQRTEARARDEGVWRAQQAQQASQQRLNTAVRQRQDAASHAQADAEARRQAAQAAQAQVRSQRQAVDAAKAQAEANRKAAQRKAREEKQQGSPQTP